MKGGLRVLNGESLGSNNSGPAFSSYALDVPMNLGRLPRPSIHFYQTRIPTIRSHMSLFEGTRSVVVSISVLLGS